MIAELCLELLSALCVDFSTYRKDTIPSEASALVPYITERHTYSASGHYCAQQCVECGCTSCRDREEEEEQQDGDEQQTLTTTRPNPSPSNVVATQPSSVQPPSYGTMPRD